MSCEHPAAPAAGPPMPVISKACFAREMNVGRSAVSAWIARHLISGDALVGDGRDQQIDSDIARRQLAKRRDVGQSLGNGRRTRIKPSAPKNVLGEKEVVVTTSLVSREKAAALKQLSSQAASGDSDLDDALRQAKLWAVQAANRKLAEEEKARAGIYVLAADTRREMAQIGKDIMAFFESVLVVIADAETAAYGVEHREVLHRLRALYRREREASAARAVQMAATLPGTVEHE